MVAILAAVLVAVTVDNAGGGVVNCNGVVTGLGFVLDLLFAIVETCLESDGGGRGQIRQRRRRKV